jgi:hypothetical protein
MNDIDRSGRLWNIINTRPWRVAVKVSGGLNCFGFKAIHTVIREFHHHHHHQWLYRPLLGTGLFLNFVIFFTQTAGLLDE